MARFYKGRSDRQDTRGVNQESFAERNFAYACCRHYWWYTAVPEAVFGLWATAVGIVLILFNVDGGINFVVALCLIVSLALFWVIPRYLNDEFLIPSGLCLKAPKKPVVNWTISGATAGIYIVIIVLAQIRSASPFLTVAGLAGLLFVIVYARSGNMRHLFEGAWVALGMAAAPLIGDLFHNTGVEYAGTALLIAGVGLLVVGCREFFKMVFDLVRAPDPGTVPGPDDEPMSRNWFSVKELEELLTSSDRRVRYLCTAFLCEYARPQILPELLRATHDQDPFVSQVARRALANIWGPDPDEVMRMHIDSSFGGRKSKGRLLTAEQIQELDKRQKVVERDSIAHEREVEKILSTKVGTDEDALSTLISLAQADDGGDDDVRLVAMELLGATHSHRAYATLIQLIMRGDREITGNAAEGFRGAASGAVIHIEPLFSDPREWVRIAGVNAGIEMLADLRSTDKADASVALEMMHDDVKRLAHHPRPVTRAMSLELLSYYGSESLSTIEEACRDRFAMVRGEAVRVLTLMNSDAATSYVLEALRDQKAFVRATAINCAAYLKLDEALPVVTELTQDADREVAALAQRLLFISKTW